MTQDFRITVETKGLEELIAKTRDPALVRGPVLGLLRRAGRRNKKVMVKNIEGGTGVAVRSIFTRLDRDKLRTLTSTHIPTKRAVNIEEGRRPGILPNSKSIERWMRAEGLDISRSEVGNMMHSIRQQGVEGKHFTQVAVEDLKNRLPGYMKLVIKQIEKRWAKKRGLS